MSSNFVPRPITTTSAAAQIAEQIRVAILQGQLAPGQRLPPEGVLARQCEVSRGTIRETIKLLSAAQLVESQRGAAGGTFIRLPGHDAAAASLGETISLWFNAGSTSLAEINDAREWIERGCVRMAANKRDDEDLEAIEATVRAMEVSGIDVDDMLAIDLDFHMAVARAAHNAVLELAMNAIHIVRPYTNTMLVPLLDIPTIAVQHRSIYEGISARSRTAAEGAFDTHIRYLNEIREQALADRRAEELSMAELTGEAHPEFERVRARLLARGHGPVG